MVTKFSILLVSHLVLILIAGWFRPSLSFILKEKLGNKGENK